MAEAGALLDRLTQRLGAMRRHLGWRGVILGALALYVLSGIYFVQADKQAVVLVFGRVLNAHVPPGLHWTWPAPLAKVIRVKLKETKRLSVGFDAPDQVLGRGAAPVKSQFLTGDRNIISIRLVVQYTIKDPVAYLFRVKEVETLIGNTIEESLNAVVVRRQVDELLTTEKVAVQQDVKGLSQSLLDSYGCGVSLLSINLESISPPDEVREAFNNVASAREDRNRIIREAESYANEILPVARGEAARALEEARSYRQRVISRAQGDTARFTSLASEYSKVPQETATRLYLETMEEVLPRIEKTIVESESGTVDFDFLRDER